MAEQNSQAERAASCPFCGKDADPENHHQGYWMVMCNGCEAEGPSARTSSEAVDRWNRRAALPAAVDAVDLPEGTKAAKFAPHTIVYTAEQVQMAIAADRRKQALTQPASIDTPEFAELLADFGHNWTNGDEAQKASRARLIAYIDGRTAGAGDATSDPLRLMFVMKDIDGFNSVEWDKYEYTTHFAEAAGHDVPDASDELRAVRMMIDAAMIAAAPSHQSPGKEGATSELQKVVDFLMGEAPLEGVKFGEKHPTKAGAFWWRLNLRAALHAARKG